MTEWLSAVSPDYNWQWPYMRHVIGQLDAVTTGTTRRLMLFLPPRHGKSELATIRYPVWRLVRRPDARVVVAAYNQTLANRFSRRARRIAETRLTLAPDRSAVEEWETVQGGTFRAVGVGGGVTGQGADLIVIDDPVKSREEAESPTYRDRVWDWYRDDLYTRLEPGGSIILIMTRWHMDDLAGRILASDDGPAWTVVSLPAEAEAGDVLGRSDGAALNPERYPLEELAKIRAVLGGYSYNALYQQRPRPRDGALFKAHWLPLVDAVPADAQRVRWWDKGATANGGDYTAGVLIASAGGVYYVEDVVRGQWSPGERDRIIRATAEADARRGHVETWGPQDPGQAGVVDADAFKRLLAGYTVRTERESGDKVTRAGPFAAQAEAGNVRVLRARWTGAYIDELVNFPTGVHDDQVDASSGAFAKLARFGTGGTGIANPFFD